MQTVVSQLIREVENLKAILSNISFIQDTYYEWKKEKEEFKKYLHKKAEELSKDRVDNRISDK